MGRSGRDVARRAGVSHPRTNQVLADLAEQGLVVVERLPRTDLYRVNRSHVLADPLEKLFKLEPGLKFDLLSLVAKELRTRHVPVREARIFGSAARGDMTISSDVDLALITPPENVAMVEEAAQDIATAVRKRFGARLNVVVGSPSLATLVKSRQGKRDLWETIQREGIDVLSDGKAVR
jgi:predicted nucleotidyltransferase